MALAIVIIAETGRLPVDNPSTHLELTMIHEAMVLEYAGPKLALVEWASGMRLTVLLALVANLFLPWGVAGAHPSCSRYSSVSWRSPSRSRVLAGVLAAGEVFIAKLRLFRVPELLAGSFLLALLAVTASYFFATRPADLRPMQDPHERGQMTQATYNGVLNLAAGAFLLAAVLIVWRRELRAIVALLAWQGMALAAIPLTEGIYQHDAALITVGVVVLLLRAVVLPLLLARAVGTEDHERRESTPLVNTTASLLITAGLTVLAYAVTRPIIALDPSPATRAVPAAFAVILIAVFVMVSRRRALSQAVGFMMLDNGIAATAFLITAGVPLIVELGASLDVLFAVLVLGLLTGHMRRTFGGTDLDQLRELRD